MPNLVFDTNFFDRLKEVNSDCELVDFICEAYGFQGIADHQQLHQMDYCPCLKEKLVHHNVTDEQVALFTLSYQGELSLEKIARDPVDLKLIVFVKENHASILLTCERKLLQLCKELMLLHWCFKAAIHHLDNQIGGIFEEDSYEFSKMFDAPGSHPFFHYDLNSRCKDCHDSCQTHKSPPKLPSSKS